MRRIPVITGLSAALLLASSGIADAATADIQGLTVEQAGGSTRALVDVPDGTEYSVFTLANPNRLVLDLHHSRFSNSFHAPGPDGVVANIRTGQPVPGDARIVFALSATVHPRSFFHNENGRTQLVVELLTAADTSRPNSPRPDPVVAVLSAQPSSFVATPATQTGESDSRVSPMGFVALPETPIAPNHASPKTGAPVAPPVSTTVLQTGTTQIPSAVDPDDETLGSDNPAMTAQHPGARTMRDVIGARQRKLMIAIDAGHGGQDVGAKGFSGTYEKNITLATARELARQVNAEPGMQAVLTRDGDYFVPLADRYRKAREAKADLFISIHADADPTHTATGSSVWVLSQRGVTSQAARWLADRENAADLIGGVSLSDKDDTLASVLLNLSQSATMKASDDAAERVHEALRDIGRTHKSHPEQANFVVLRSPDVPSMLVETAFITNAGEERHLNDPKYRTQLANAVLSGVRSYFADNPLPGTQFASLHPRNERRGSRAVASAAQVEVAVASAPPVHQTVAPAQALVQLASAADTDRIHVVQRGENLIDIADRFGVSLQNLRSLNDLHGDSLRRGQRLRIPARASSG